jgi:FYVE zinc finger
MRQADFVIRECQDCHDEMDDGKRRTQCKKCGKLVCSWCYHHAHNIPVGNGMPPLHPARISPIALSARRPE